MSAPTQEETLRELIREANAATKDLRKAIKEGQDFLDKLIADKLSDLIAEQVKIGLDEYRTTMDAAIQNTQRTIFDRFDTLANIMLGKGKPGDIEEMTKRYEATRLNASGL